MLGYTSWEKWGGGKSHTEKDDGGLHWHRHDLMRPAGEGRGSDPPDRETVRAERLEGAFAGY